MPVVPASHEVRPSPPAAPAGTFNATQSRFREFLSQSIVLNEEWERLDAHRRGQILACRDEETLITRLVGAGLLCPFQASRIRAGKRFGLVLGNYRVLDQLGAGGMGIIYLAEHIRMRKRVAIKTLTVTADQDERLLGRFVAEMRAVSQLRHPNIVSAFDADELHSQDPDTGTLHYFVMEYVQGQDLEALIESGGPIAIDRSCQIAHQVADALVEAHRQKLIHRDIKPSNVLLTPDGTAKLLDFGLARHYHHRLTEPGSVLGTIGYMAPEQAKDATNINPRADIYSLGATLYWCLTGKDPFPITSNVADDLVQRLNQPPPSVRASRSEIPVKLDDVVARMMAVKPEDRYADAQSVMRALLPFIRVRLRGDLLPTEHSADVSTAPAKSVTARPVAQRALQRVLIVDDEPGIRSFCSMALKADGIVSELAVDGQQAMDLLASKTFDLILLDIDMPRLNGVEVMKRLRAVPPAPNLKVLMVSGRTSADDMAQLLGAGADDFLPKPFSIAQLRARVKAALKLKEAQDRSDLLNRHLLSINAELEQTLSLKDVDLVSARNAMVLALANIVEVRDNETGAHLARLQQFCRILGDEAIAGNDFGPAVDAAFVHTLEACAPLHDIGKVALPDQILLKPGKLDTEERLQMQTHTVIGAETLRESSRKFQVAAGFLQMAVDVARSHHERFDGKGYPDRLAGEDIPLAARFLAIADVYDALRSRRVYKPALPHTTAVLTMTEGSSGQFDPKLIRIFQRCSARFEQVFREHGE